MVLCLATGLATATVAASTFTLAWTHSIERVRWEEVWRVEGEALVLDSVRVRGHGAGMEPGEGATLKDGVWTWHPRTRHAVLRLTRSPYTADYEWCEDSQPCVPLGTLLPSDGAVTELRACPAVAAHRARDDAPRTA
ncbi:MAG: DUF1850 domain-containing protein [Thauera sp.]